MSAQHTQGRASLDTKGVGIDLPNHIPIDIGQHAAAAQVVWKMEDYERSPHCEETARRLVACWNACEGIDTEDLEAGSVSIIQKLHDDAAKRVLEQRDELLEALQLCRQHMYDHASNTTDGAFDKLCAAIAKATNHEA
jgi:hypothetical protein